MFERKKTNVIKILLIIIIQFFFFLPSTNFPKQPTIVYAAQDVYSSGSGTWTRPANVFEITIECWGGGGGAAGPTNTNGQINGGGGGGGYARVTISNPSSSYTYSVGSAGTAGSKGTDNATNGGNSTINSTLLIAYGGGKGTYNANGGGAGGSGGSGSGTGGTFFSGGSGSTSGGGGGGAGSSSNGQNATAGTGGNGGTGNVDGKGGNAGIGNNANGISGSAWGGGGGSGVGKNGISQNGAAGTIIITYTVNSSPTISPNTTDVYVFNADLTPTLEFTGTDVDEDEITYNIQIDSVNTFDSVNLLDKISGTHLGFENTITAIDTDPFYSGEKISYTVQEADILDYGTYYWRARAKDPAKTNTYSSWTTTRSFIIDTGISIVLTSDGNIDFGPISAGSNKSTVTLSDTQTILNDGLSTIDLRIKTSNAVGDSGSWTLGQTTGETDIFVHEFSINSGSAWTKFTTVDTYQAMTTGIASEATQNFDLQVTVPTTTSYYDIKSISVTIQGILP